MEMDKEQKYLLSVDLSWKATLVELFDENEWAFEAIRAIVR